VRKLFSSKSKRKKQSNVRYRKYIPHVCIVFVCVGLIAVGAWVIFSGQIEDATARNEYEQLRDIFMSPPDSQMQHPDNEDTDTEAEDVGPETGENEPDNLSLLSMEELARINDDFIGWISIENHIEYPVVRGTDNDKYIHITFSGERNRAGAIFMDYRNRGGFDDRITILFGHRTRDGTMFSPLLNYTNRSFLQENPLITITTRNGDILTYRIFAAKRTDAWDVAYEAGFSGNTQAAPAFPGAPANATRFLLLSTCSSSEDRNERILVFAALDD